jgi:hypothetical protein
MKGIEGGHDAKEKVRQRVRSEKSVLLVCGYRQKICLLDCGYRQKICLLVYGYRQKLFTSSYVIKVILIENWT